MPALLTRKSKLLALPVARQRLPDLRGEGREAGAVLDIERERNGAAAALFDLRDHGIGLVAPAAVGQDDVDAVRGELERGVAAEAAAGAGDESDLASHGLAPGCCGSEAPAACDNR